MRAAGALAAPAFAASRALAAPALAAALIVAAGCGGGGDERPPAPPASPAPPDAETRYEKALSELGAGRTWAGLWHMTRLLRDRPDHAGALSALGIHAYQQQRYDDVPLYLERLADVRSLNRDETLALADACSRLNRFAAAESLFTIALEREPDDPQILVARGQVRRKQADLVGAAEDFGRAAAQASSAGSTRLLLASVLLDRNSVEEAWETLKPLDEASAGDAAQLHLLRARVLARRGDEQGLGGDLRGRGVGTTKKAAAELEQALEIDPENLDALHLLARVRRKLGDLEAARALAARHRDALRALDNTALLHAVKALVQGAIAAENGDDEAARAAWERGLEDDPENLNLHCVLGPLYGKLGRREEARASYTVLRAAMNGAVPGPLFLRTGQELRRRGLPKAAAEQFEVAVNRMPGNEEAIWFLALARSEIGDWDGAIAAAAPLEAPPAKAPAGSR